MAKKQIEIDTELLSSVGIRIRNEEARAKEWLKAYKGKNGHAIIKEKCHFPNCNGYITRDSNVKYEDFTKSQIIYVNKLVQFEKTIDKAYKEFLNSKEKKAIKRTLKRIFQQRS